MHKVNLIKAASGLIALACIMTGTGTAFAAPATYTYDATDRLIYANDNGTLIEYVYDKVGNLRERKIRYSVSSTPSLKDFGSVNVGGTSSSQTFTVTNTGSLSVTISTINKTGHDASMFTLSADTCSGSTLAPLATCTIGATFSPLTMGSKSANLFIAFSTPAVLTLSIPLSGNGLTPRIEVSPASLNFGNIGIASVSSAQAVVITNSGNTNLVLGTLAITGSNAAEFQLGVTPSCSGQTIVPSANCTVPVAFAPLSVGVKNASLTIPSNDSTMPVVTVNLTGTGMAYVRIPRTPDVYFPTLRAAYDAAADGEVIQVQTTTLVENITFNRNISVTVDGGYDADFSSNSTGMTLIQGSLHTSLGATRLRNMRTVQ